VRQLRPGRGENGAGAAGGARGGARLPFNEAEGNGRTRPRRASWRRLLQRQERAVAEPRGVGDGADRWGPGVSCWARQLPGAARLGRHGACGWAGAAGPSGKRGRRAGLLAAVLGRGKKKERGQRAECEEGRNERNFPFFFL